MKKLLMLAILIAAAAFGGTAIARADVNEDAFLLVMHQKGITHINGDTGLLLVGYEICSHLDQNGGDLYEATNYVRAATGLPSSGYVVGASVAAFCPEYGTSITPGYVA